MHIFPREHMLLNKSPNSHQLRVGIGQPCGRQGFSQPAHQRSSWVSLFVHSVPKAHDELPASEGFLQLQDNTVNWQEVRLKATAQNTYRVATPVHTSSSNRGSTS